MKITLAANGDVGAALRTYLAELFASDTARNAYVAFPFGGLATSANRFEFLKDPSQVEQAYEFAVQVNAIPQYEADHAWYFNNNMLWHQYRYWLDQCDPAPITLTKEEVKRLRRARRFCEKHLHDYWTYRTEFQNAEDEFQNWSTMPAGERPPDYAARLTAARDRRDRALESWDIKGRRLEFDAQYATMNDLSRRDPALTKQALREHLGVPISYEGGEFYWSSLVPDNAFDAGFDWQSFECLFEDSQAAGAEPARYELTRATATGERGEVARVAAAGSKINFEMVRLIVDRDWFAPLLLDSRSWKWPKSTPQDPFAGYPLSDGNAAPTGNLPMVPSEVVFVRNIVVSGISAPAALQRLTHTRGDSPGEGRLLWSGFNVVGIAAENDADAARGMVSLPIQSADLQYFAFICWLLPKSPDPEWRLWDQTRAAQNT